jgi:hypothetical protein
MLRCINFTGVTANKTVQMYMYSFQNRITAAAFSSRYTLAAIPRDAVKT